MDFLRMRKETAGGGGGSSRRRRSSNRSVNLLVANMTEDQMN